MQNQSWKITCHACSQLPHNTVEAPCCGAVYCWDCVLNVTNCKGCSAELTPDMCKPATAIEKLINAQVPQTPTHNTMVACPECATNVTYIRMEEHLAQCPKVMVACSNGCGRQLQRKDVADHIANDCHLTVMPCPYGCDTSLQPLYRHSFQAHMDANMSLHLQHLAKKVEDQEKIIDTMKNQSSCCIGIKACMKNAWTAWQDTNKRKEYIKNTFPPRTIFSLVLFCMGLLMLSALPFVVQGVFLFVVWRKHPKTINSTPTARILFRLKAFTALCCLFVVTQFPFWLVLFVLAPVMGLIYMAREEILSSLQQIVSA